VIISTQQKRKKRKKKIKKNKNKNSSGSEGRQNKNIYDTIEINLIGDGCTHTYTHTQRGKKYFALLHTLTFNIY